MITSISQLDSKKIYSYADYLTWQFEEYVELFKGYFVPMGAPKTKHQNISSNILASVFEIMKFQKTTCKVFHAPFDVRFPTNPDATKDREIYTVVQPDICIVCDQSKLDERGCIGAPEMIIEILSKGTEKKDKVTKLQIYEEFGVKEYWVVYPNEKFIEAYLLSENGTYGTPEIYSSDAEVPLSLFEDSKVQAINIFRD
jgi:Uma2 family endonuclease